MTTASLICSCFFCYYYHDKMRTGTAHHHHHHNHDSFFIGKQPAASSVLPVPLSLPLIVLVVVITLTCTSKLLFASSSYAHHHHHKSPTLNHQYQAGTTVTAATLTMMMAGGKTGGTSYRRKSRSLFVPKNSKIKNNDDEIINPLPFLPSSFHNNNKNYHPPVHLLLRQRHQRQLIRDRNHNNKYEYNNCNHVVFNNFDDDNSPLLAAVAASAKSAAAVATSEGGDSSSSSSSSSQQIRLTGVGRNNAAAVPPTPAAVVMNSPLLPSVIITSRDRSSDDPNYKQSLQASIYATSSLIGAGGGDDSSRQHKSASFQPVQSYSAQERLYQRIIANEQLTRPDLTDVPINVTVRVILIKLQDLVEKSELMETTVRVQIGWRDKRLAWDKADYGQLSEILLPSSSVWIPDLAIINSVSDVYSVVRDTRFEIKVESDGQLWWHPTGVLRTFCKLHLSYFPFDRQKCSIIVESPTFDRRFLNLRLRSERTPVDLRMYVESETWRLEKTFGTSQQIKAGVHTYFSRIEFWLIIERARLYHSINFILPCFILSSIQTLFFFLPATHPQRVGSTTVTMLSVMVFQSMVVAQLPKTSESVPLLSIYIDLVILVSATSVCASIFTALCHFNNDRRAPVPLWLQNCCSLKHSPCFSAPSQPPHRDDTVTSTTAAAITPATNENPQGAETIVLCPPPPPLQTQHPAAGGPIYKIPSLPHRQSVQRPHSLSASSGRYILHGITEEAEQRRREDLVRRRSYQSEGFTIVQMPSPDEQLYSLSESEEMTVFAPVSQQQSVFQPDDSDGDGNAATAALNAGQSRKSISSIRRRQSTLSGKKHVTTWLDVLSYINLILGWTCALAISLGPAIIFGVIPSVVDHQDFPAPIGENFTLLTSAQIRKT